MLDLENKCSVGAEPPTKEGKEIKTIARGSHILKLKGLCHLETILLLEGPCLLHLNKIVFGHYSTFCTLKTSNKATLLT